MTFDGIVLAGGEARRLGGIAKPEATVGGRRLLDVALDALSGAATAIVVGPTMPTPHDVTWTREDPPGGGPVAALAAGLALVEAPTVVVLAADLPFISSAAIDALRLAKGDDPAAIAIDGTGRDQPLIGCFDTARLRAVFPDVPSGVPMRSLLAALEQTGPIHRLGLGGDRPATLDCDTPADLSRAEELA